MRSPPTGSSPTPHRGKSWATPSGRRQVAGQTTGRELAPAVPTTRASHAATSTDQSSQKFASVHASLSDHFCLERHLVDWQPTKNDAQPSWPSARSAQARPCLPGPRYIRCRRVRIERSVPLPDPRRTRDHQVMLATSANLDVFRAEQTRARRTSSETVQVHARRRGVPTNYNGGFGHPEDRSGSTVSSSPSRPWASVSRMQR